MSWDKISHLAKTGQKLWIFNEILAKFLLNHISLWDFLSHLANFSGIFGQKKKKKKEKENEKKNEQIFQNLFPK